jgi:uncharacterized protein YjiS (DUF1127 family)
MKSICLNNETQVPIYALYAKTTKLVERPMARFFNFTRKSAGMRRSTLLEMFNMDSSRLSDMGLTRYDIAEALRGGADAGQLLAARRDARASSWLR